MNDPKPKQSAADPETEPAPENVRPGTDTDSAPRDALIFLNGLGLAGAQGKSITGVVARIEAAFEKADTSTASWRVHWSEEAVRNTPAANHSDPTATIYRKDDSNETAVVDIFHYDWSKRLLSNWESRSLFTRTFYVLFTLLKVWEYPRKFEAAKRSPRGRAQLGVALVMLAAVTFYGAALVIASVETAKGVWDSATGDDSPSTPTTTSTSTPTSTPTTDDDRDNAAGDRSAQASDVSNWQRFVILSGLGIAFFKKQGDRLRSSGGALTAVEHYVRLGDQRQQMIGELEILCDELSKTTKYPTVRIVGYSFGAIVAIDALFPTTGPPTGAFQSVKTLVTIGAPYDFVKAIRSNWRSARHSASNPPDWVNIYAPTDILGSNFRNDSGQGPAERGVELVASSAIDGQAQIEPETNLVWDLGVDLSFSNLVMLNGFTNHGKYWGDDDETDHNVFDDLIVPIYGDTEILS